MSQLYFNLRFIVICVCFLALLGFILYKVTGIAKIKNNKIFKSAFCALTALIMIVIIVFTFAGMSFKEIIYSGTIVDINDKGGWSIQLSHDYEITIRDKNGENIIFTTPVLSSVYLENKISNLNSGDFCRIKCNRFCTMYDIELYNE